MPAATWIVTADRAGARIIESRHDGIAVLEDMSNEEGRLQDAELGTDRPGRFEGGAKARHGANPTESLHEHIAKAFARNIAEKLRLGRAAGRFDRLMLAAEPRMLGMLREALDAHTAHLVTASVPKDLQHASLDEVAAKLPPR